MKLWRSSRGFLHFKMPNEESNTYTIFHIYTSLQGSFECRIEKPQQHGSQNRVTGSKSLEGSST
jgi:hypothetical protein